MWAREKLCWHLPRDWNCTYIRAFCALFSRLGIRMSKCYGPALEPGNLRAKNVEVLDAGRQCPGRHGFRVWVTHRVLCRRCCSWRFRFLLFRGGIGRHRSCSLGRHGCCCCTQGGGQDHVQPLAVLEAFDQFLRIVA